MIDELLRNCFNVGASMVAQQASPPSPPRLPPLLPASQMGGCFMFWLLCFQSSSLFMALESSGGWPVLGTLHPTEGLREALGSCFGSAQRCPLQPSEESTSKWMTVSVLPSFSVKVCLSNTHTVLKKIVLKTRFLKD